MPVLEEQLAGGVSDLDDGVVVLLVRDDARPTPDEERVIGKVEASGRRRQRRRRVLPRQVPSRVDGDKPIVPSVSDQEGALEW